MKCARTWSAVTNMIYALLPLRPDVLHLQGELFLTRGLEADDVALVVLRRPHLLLDVVDAGDDLDGLAVDGVDDLVLLAVLATVADDDGSGGDRELDVAHVYC